MEETGTISIIVPTLNEEESLGKCLARTQGASRVERIVVDGGSRDRTVEIARASGARVVAWARGRARQMNRGAELASGDFLLFLHADTLLPGGYADWVRTILSRPGVAAGAFGFALDASSPGLRIIEKITNLRSRYLQLPYGDQAIFMKAALLREVGGFPDQPIMEDFALIRRLQGKGRIKIAPVPAVTSARRWHLLGLWRTTLINQAVIAAYYFDLSPGAILSLARRK